jgi:hypothetical protein
MPRMEDGAQIYLVDGPTGLHSRMQGAGPRDLSRVALWRKTWSGRGPNETGVFLFHGDRLVGYASVSPCDLNIDDAPLLQAQHRFARVECRPSRGRWHPQESECRPQWNPTCTLVVVGAE